MKKQTSGQIYRAFKAEDKNTVIRRLNLRMYCKEANVDHTICENKWLISFEDVLNHLNPKRYKEHIKPPRLRSKKTAIREWNNHHRKRIKHYIVDCICDSGKVFVMKHGRYNIINYDELEQELIKRLKEKGKY